MKKIAMMMGEDFWLRIPVNNESAGKHLDLDRVKDLYVFLEGAYGGVWNLKWERDGAQHNGIAVKVEAEELPLGTYAVMMTGRTVNDDPFRIKRNLFIRLVDDPKEADAKRTSYNEEKAYWAGPAVMSKMLDRDGLNAYELAVVNGFEGTLEEFLDGLEWYNKNTNWTDEQKRQARENIGLDFEGIDDVPTEESENLVRSGGVKAALSGKVDKEAGKGLSTNDYTTAEKTKLANLPTSVATADEEDITVVSNALKLKNKAYDVSSFSGLGRTYLRKNVVSNKNVLTQAMMSAANTVYHIQYDYDLDGETITVPAGCVLEFDGGSLKNGVVDFNNCEIKADKKIFDSITPVQDSKYYGYINPAWFGVVDDDVTDNSDSLSSIITFIKKLKFTNNFRNGIFDNPTIKFETAGSIKISTSWLVDTPCNIVGFPTFHYEGNREAFSGAIIITNIRKNIVEIGGIYSTSKDFSDGIRFAGLCLRDVLYSEIKTKLIQGFYSGILFNGDTNQQTACTKIESLDFRDCLYAIDVDVKNRSWHNEIEVYGFMTGFTSGGVVVPSGLSYTAAIRFTNDGSYNPNSWRIHDIAIEGKLNNTYPQHLIYCDDNTKLACFAIYSIRNENTDGGISINKKQDRIQIWDTQYGNNVCSIFMRDSSLPSIVSANSVNTAIKYFSPFWGIYYTGDININIVGANWKKIFIPANSRGEYSKLLADVFIFNLFGTGANSYFRKTNTFGQYAVGFSIASGQTICLLENDTLCLDCVAVTDLDNNIIDFEPDFSYLANGISFYKQTYNLYIGLKKNNSSFKGGIAIKNNGSEERRVWFRFLQNNSVDCTIISNQTLVSVEESIPTHGTTAERPVLKNLSWLIGFEYFDTTLGKIVVWNGLSWVNPDINKGDTAGRPTLSFDYDGFPYYDTDIQKQIFARIDKTPIVETSLPSRESSVFENTLTEGVEYWAGYDRPQTWGGRLTFRKEEDSSEDEIVILSNFISANKGKTFIAPDPNEYPYIYMQNDYSLSETVGVYSPSTSWVDENGYTATISKGTTSERPTNVLTTSDKGFEYLDTTIEKPIYWEGTKWVEEDGATAGVARSGTFANKPAAADIYVGFKYFCTDKQTTEGATNGIEIIHKGNGVWVDALGRVVS